MWLKKIIESYLFYGSWMSNVFFHRLQSSTPFKSGKKNVVYFEENFSFGQTSYLSRLHHLYKIIHNLIIGKRFQSSIKSKGTINIYFLTDYYLKLLTDDKTEIKCILVNSYLIDLCISTYLCDVLCSLWPWSSGYAWNWSRTWLWMAKFHHTHLKWLPKGHPFSETGVHCCILFAW